MKEDLIFFTMYEFAFISKLKEKRKEAKKLNPNVNIPEDESPEKVCML